MPAKPSMSEILAMGPDEGKDEDVSEASATTVAAEDVLSAVKAGDADALSVALEDFLRACGAVGSESTSDDDDGY